MDVDIQHSCAPGRGRVCGLLAEVVSNEPLCREHRRLVLRAAGLPACEPGQFVHVRPAAQAPGSAPPVFLRRPLSIADYRRAADGPLLELIYREVGRGTRALGRLVAGGRLDVTGPLGVGFRLPESQRPIALVGGGVGIPPLLYASRRLWELGQREVVVVFGAASGELLPLELTATPSDAGEPRRCVRLPGSADYPAIISTDDGSLGMRGVVTAALERWSAGLADPSAALVLACGPEPMLQAVAELTRRLGQSCQLCIERFMACGMGTCLSCVVRVRQADGNTRWALTCSEGPVFERDTLACWD